MTAEVLAFLDNDPQKIALFEAAEAAILAPGEAEMTVAKTQISWGNPLKYAFLSRPNRVTAEWPKGCLVLTFGLSRRAEEPCVLQAVEPYPGRWTHHTALTAPEDVDETVRALLREAYGFAQAKRRKHR